MQSSATKLRHRRKIYFRNWALFFNRTTRDALVALSEKDVALILTRE